MLRSSPRAVTRRGTTYLRQRGQTLFEKLRHRLAREHGFALIAAIGFSVVLGIAGTTTMIYTTSNEGSAARSKADRRALSLAEAGLAFAYSTLYNAPDPTLPGAVPQRTETLEGGTATYYGTLDTAANVWTLTGVGRVANPTPGADVTRTVRGKVRLGKGQQGTANNAIWNYVYADTLDTCMTLANSVNVDVPLYVRGNLCLQNSATVTGPMLQVGGTITLYNNSTQIGDPSLPVPEIHVGTGCILSPNPLHSPCSSADRVYGTLVDNQPTGLVKPPLDLAGWYQNSYPGPLHGCTEGSFPGGFDNDTTLNHSRAAVDLLPAQPYDCTVRDAQGTVIGRIAWTGGDPGTLTIAGTIFFDGDITFQNSASAVYQGRATIYSSGKITFTNSNDVCGVAGCGSDWNPTQNLLAFVAGGTQTDTSFEMVNSSIFQGAVYAANDYVQGNSVVMWGPVVARQLYLNNSTENHYVPLGTLLSGMPATYEQVVTLANEAESWG